MDELILSGIIREDDIEYGSEPDDIDNDDFSGGEDDLADAIRKIVGSQNDDVNDDDDNPDDDDNNDIDDDNPDDDDEPIDDELEDDQNGRQVQSKEDNARFAQMRRQQELDRRVQAELERVRNESPEFQLAQRLSTMYGKPVNEIMADIEEAQLQEEARLTKLPVELLRERQAERQQMANLQEQLNALKFESWQSKIQADSARLMDEYKVLTQEDIDAATDYMLTTMRNVDMPLEDAIFAVHGKKIVESLASAKMQDDLAKQSGRRRNTPLAPNNGKPSKGVSLSADEKAAARAFGMTDEEYIKYK